MARVFGFGRYYGRRYGGFYGKKFEIYPDYNNYCLVFKIDRTAAAWIDGAVASNVFKNTAPVNSEICDMIEIYINDANNRIEFKFDGTTKGYIDNTGTHDGEP